MIRLYKHIKSLLPNNLKYPFWYLFKSPQRRFGWFTVWNDLSGLMMYCFYSIFPSRKLQPVSVCTGLYNRSEAYLNHFLGSLEKSKDRDLIELSVFDCGSNDISDLQEKIRQKWKGRLVFHSEAMPFTRSSAFNRSIRQSSHDILFICDADMNIPENIVQLCNMYTGKKLVWYPIVYFVFKNRPAVVQKGNGEWMVYGGKGMFACRRSHLSITGYLNEQYTEWGREDDDLWERFVKHDFRIIRNKQKGLLHQWHPSFNPKYQKYN